MSKKWSPSRMQIVGVVILVPLILIVSLFWWAVLQSEELHRNLDLIEPFAEQMNEQLEGSGRFREVTVSATTALRGSVLVFGVVSNEAELEELCAIIEDAEPPAHVMWSVDIQSSIGEE